MSYRSLIDAAADLAETGFLDDCESSPDTRAREYLNRNRVALAAARAALQGECAVRLRFDQEYYTEHTEDVGHLRNLAKTFALELRHAKRRDDFPAAVRIGIDLFQLSNAARRGGLILDFLVSIAFSSMAIEGLREGRAHCDEQLRKSLRDALRRIENEREPLRAIVERDRKWEVAVGWQDAPLDVANFPLPETDTGIPEDQQQAVLEALQRFTDLPSDEKTSQYRQFDNRDRAMQRMFFVDLALRTYQAIHHTYPDRLEPLVPSICSDIPCDPFTDAPFRYQRQGTDEFVLYSPGPTKIDHGGNFSDWLKVATGQADLCLDVGDYWWDEFSI